MLEDDLVDHAVLFGLVGVHDVVAFDVFFDALDGLAGVLGEQRVNRGPHTEDFLGMQVDVGGLAAQAAHPWLVNQNTGVGQGEALLGRATAKQHGGNRGSLTDAESRSD